MPLPQPFADLSEQAQRCNSHAEVVNTLREAGTLLRLTDPPLPAPDHSAQWYSGVIRSVLASPAGTDLSGGAVVPTSALGREELLPGMSVRWVRRGRAELSELSRVLAAADIPSSPSDGDPIDLIDAGHFHPDGPDRILLERAVEKRDRESLISGIARWAAGVKAAALTRTPDRLIAGVAGGLLSSEEEVILAEAWRAGLGRRLAQWRNEESQGDDSPPEVVDVARRLAERNNISVATEGEWS